MNRTFIVFSCLALSSVAGAFGMPPMPRFDETLSSEERALARLAFEGLWDGREQLVSASVAVTCQPRGEGPPRPDPLFLAFDRGASRLRFDQTSHGVKTQIARTPRETLLHVSGGYILERHPPNYETELDATKPFEPRLAGLLTLGEFFFRFDYAGFTEFLAQTVCTRCLRLPDELIQLDLEYVMLNTTEKFRRTIVLDRKRDYAPVELRVEFVSGAPEGSPLKAGLMNESKAEWKLVNGAYVPTELSMDDLRTRNGATLRFEWSDVNRPIADKYFTAEGFGAPGGTAIFDQRLGTPIFERSLGGTRHLERQEVSRERNRAWNWRSWVVATNILVIAVTAMLVLARRLRG